MKSELIVLCNIDRRAPPEDVGVTLSIAYLKLSKMIMEFAKDHGRTAVGPITKTLKSFDAPYDTWQLRCEVETMKVTNVEYVAHSLKYDNSKYTFRERIRILFKGE